MAYAAQALSELHALCLIFELRAFLEGFVDFLLTLWAFSICNPHDCLIGHYAGTWSISACNSQHKSTTIEHLLMLYNSVRFFTRDCHCIFFACSQTLNVSAGAITTDQHIDCMSQDALTVTFHSNTLSHYYVDTSSIAASITLAFTTVCEQRIMNILQVLLYWDFQVILAFTSWILLTTPLSICKSPRITQQNGNACQGNVKQVPPDRAQKWFTISFSSPDTRTLLRPSCAQVY